MPPFINLAGQRFGRLLVVERAGSGRNGTIWRCACDCGNETLSQVGSLRSGASQSCGCSRAEFLKDTPIHRSHGGSTERLYKVWRGMHDRCTQPTHNRYPSYGGRGIRVCSEWANDYSAFRSWALANGYDASAPRGACTLDRIDVDGDYCPTNCRWVDSKIQASNRRKEAS